MYPAYENSGIGFFSLLVVLVILLVPGIICGNMCKRLSSMKNLPHPYFWTGFFLSLLGLVYVGFLSLNTPAPGQAPEKTE